MCIESMYIYLVKSMCGILVECIIFIVFGLLGDCCFMVVDLDGQFIIQCDCFVFVQIQVLLQVGYLLLCKGEEEVMVVILIGLCMKVVVWCLIVDVVVVVDSVNVMFLCWIGCDVKFVFVDVQVECIVNFEWVGDDVFMGFVDGYLVFVMIIGLFVVLNYYFSE